MILKCIKPDFTVRGKTLTIGKLYEGIPTKKEFFTCEVVYYRIVNDFGSIHSYHGSLFIDIEEERNKKLKELGILLKI